MQVYTNSAIGRLCPHLEYCSTVWIMEPTPQKRLHEQHVAVARSRHTHGHTPIYKLKLKTLELRRVILSVCQVYKINHKLDCILYFTFNTRYEVPSAFSLV